MNAPRPAGPPHTDKEYERELQQLRDQILLMGAKVEQMLQSCMKALVSRDSDLAQQTIASDEQIDQLEVESDEMCLRILARRQPVASDLRFLTVALKLVTDLERIGDLAVNTCERVVELNQEPPLKPYVDLPRMSEVAQAMVREALDAFVARDADRARAVIERDSEVDAYYGQIFRELLTYMMENPHNIFRATRVQSIAKYLERVGDHATNLAEEVVFMVKGKDIRHAGIRVPRSPQPMPRGILFLCVHNSSRSQMAEGWARMFMPGVKVHSAGSQPTAVNPYAVRAMQEVGIDLSKQSAKPLSAVPMPEVDLVVSLCSEEICPPLPQGTAHVRWPLADPATATGTEQEIEAAFRRTRDELKRRVASLAAG